MIELDISQIEQKLQSLSTKTERLNYLNETLFKWKKKQLEGAYDNQQLERLKVKTATDYEKYMSVFDNGGLIYWDGRHDESTATRHGIKNVKLLLERLRIEGTQRKLRQRVEIFEALLLREQQNLDSNGKSKSRAQLSEFAVTQHGNVVEDKKDSSDYEKGEPLVGNGSLKNWLKLPEADIFQKIVDHYSNRKPYYIHSYFLFAAYRLSILTFDPSKMDISLLFNTLTAAFENVGSYENFRDHTQKIKTSVDSVHEERTKKEIEVLTGLL